MRDATLTLTKLLFLMAVAALSTAVVFYNEFPYHDHLHNLLVFIDIIYAVITVIMFLVMIGIENNPDGFNINPTKRINKFRIKAHISTYTIIAIVHALGGWIAAAFMWSAAAMLTKYFTDKFNEIYDKQQKDQQTNKDE